MSVFVYIYIHRGFGKTKFDYVRVCLLCMYGFCKNYLINCHFDYIIPCCQTLFQSLCMRVFLDVPIWWNIRFNNFFCNVVYIDKSIGLKCIMVPWVGKSLALHFNLIYRHSKVPSLTNILKTINLLNSDIHCIHFLRWIIEMLKY